jgi:hypothetical protein
MADEPEKPAGPAPAPKPVEQPQKPPAPPAAPAQPGKGAAVSADAVVNALIENWLAKHIRNSAFSAHTPSWNALQSALPSLKAAIREVMPKEG